MWWWVVGRGGVMVQGAPGQGGCSNTVHGKVVHNDLLPEHTLSHTHNVHTHTMYTASQRTYLDTHFQHTFSTHMFNTHTHCTPPTLFFQHCGKMEWEIRPQPKPPNIVSYPNPTTCASGFASWMPSRMVPLCVYMYVCLCVCVYVCVCVCVRVLKNDTFCSCQLLWYYP